MEILAFDRGFDRNAFSCGEPDLDNWLKTGAGQQERANNTRTFLAVDGSKVIGYYATTAYRLGLDEAAEMYGVGKRAYPIPAVLLARLAVDVGCQSRGIGSKLLLHALSQIAEASRHVGFEVVVVHAIDRDAGRSTLSAASLSSKIMICIYSCRLRTCWLLWHPYPLTRTSQRRTAGA